MTAIEKSNDGLSPLPKLLISHGLPVLSGSNPQVVRKPPREYHYPPPPPKKKKKKKKKKSKEQTSPAPHKKKGPREKIKKKKRKKEGAIFANPPSEDPLVDEPLWGKGS